MKLGLLTSAALPELNLSDRSLKVVLEKHGHHCEILIWDQIQIGAGKTLIYQSEEKIFDGLIIRSPWDYYKKLPQFLNFTKNCPVPLMNPADLIEWNSNKKYLLRFEKAGVPAVPTKIFSALEDLQSASLPWEKIVVKPSVSASSFMTYLWEKNQIHQNTDQLKAIFQHSEVVVQPFIPEIQEFGEMSLVYFRCGGKPCFSHAVVKRAKSGDFRIQQDHGGSLHVYEPTARDLEFGDYVLQQISEPWVYARVDAIPSKQGLLLCELEMIEPELFMATAKNKEDLFYQAICDFLDHSP